MMYHCSKDSIRVNNLFTISIYMLQSWSLFRRGVEFLSFTISTRNEKEIVQKIPKNTFLGFTLPGLLSL